MMYVSVYYSVLLALIYPLYGRLAAITVLFLMYSSQLTDVFLVLVYLLYLLKL